MPGLFDTIADTITAQAQPPTPALRLRQAAQGAESHAADVVAPKALLGKFIFVPGLGWAEWDGRRWSLAPTSAERAVQAVRICIDHIEREYRTEADRLEAELLALEKELMASVGDEEKVDDKGKPLKPDAILMLGDEEKVKAYEAMEKKLRAARSQASAWLNLLSEGHINNVTKLCRRVDGVLTDINQLDAHPDLLNCTNGVVDLRTGEVGDHDPSLLITKLAGGACDPSVKHEAWDKALKAVWAPEGKRDEEDGGAYVQRYTREELLTWFQMRMGQTITGYMPDDDSLTICTGGGENGKTTVMTGCLRAAGDYYTLVSERVLMANPGQHPTELMDFRGTRFALMEETPEEGRLDTHRLKMTVGTPQIKARRIAKDPVTFDATHTLWINTNHVPQVDATDHATWRRLKLMPWPYKYVKPREDGMYAANEKPGDKTLRPTIQTDPAIPTVVLTWLVKGAIAWYKQRSKPRADPEIVQQAVREWRSESDVAFLYCSTKLVADEEFFITGADMKSEIDQFLASQGKHAWSAQLINQRLPAAMEEAGIKLTATAGKASKVRKDDKQSLTPRPRWILVNGVSVEAPEQRTTLEVGKTVRMWRGVRFRTDADDAEEARMAREADRGLKVVGSPW
jgi:P4 family phage/plasmid primase-like protien